MLRPFSISRAGDEWRAGGEYSYEEEMELLEENLERTQGYAVYCIQEETQPCFKIFAIYLKTEGNKLSIIARNLLTDREDDPGIKIAEIGPMKAVGVSVAYTYQCQFRMTKQGFDSYAYCPGVRTYRAENLYGRVNYLQGVRGVRKVDPIDAYLVPAEMTDEFMLYSCFWVHNGFTDDTQLASVTTEIMITETGVAFYDPDWGDRTHISYSGDVSEIVRFNYASGAENNFDIFTLRSESVSGTSTLRTVYWDEASTIGELTFNASRSVSITRTDEISVWSNGGLRGEVRYRPPRMEVVTTGGLRQLKISYDTQDYRDEWDGWRDVCVSFSRDYSKIVDPDNPGEESPPPRGPVEGISPLNGLVRLINPPVRDTTPTDFPKIPENAKMLVDIGILRALADEDVGLRLLTEDQVSEILTSLGLPTDIEAGDPVEIELSSLNAFPWNWESRDYTLLTVLAV